MAFLKSLFGKLKKEKTDGQEEYFREDFPPVVNQPSKKRPEPKVEEKTEKPVAEKKAATKTETDKTAAVKPAKKEEKPASKPSMKAAKSSTKTKELSSKSPETKGAVAIKESKNTANGKWDIQRAKDGRYFFSLYASNHTVIAYSQVYSSTTAVTTGIKSVITNAPKCEIEDTTLKKPVSLPCP